MWFEKLAEGIEDNNSEEAVKALYANMYYYFAATCFGGLIWLLWKVVELRASVTCNLSLLAVVFGLMLLTVNGLRQLKSWAKILLMLNYLGLIGGAIVGLVYAGKTLMGEVTSGGVIAVALYLLIILLYGYGLNLMFSPDARKLNWR